MKLFPVFIFTIVLLFSACKEEESTLSPSAGQLQVDSLEYSAFTWYVDRNTNDHKFYIGHHVRIDSNGSYIAMRRSNFMSAPVYLTGKASDSLRIQLDSLLTKNTFDSVYKILPQPGHEYTGFYYNLHFSRSGENKDIQYVPPVAPEALKTITALLDTLIFHTRTQTLDTLQLAKYSAQLELKSKNVFPSFRRIDTTESKIDAIRRY